MSAPPRRPRLDASIHAYAISKRFPPYSDNLLIAAGWTIGNLCAFVEKPEGCDAGTGWMWGIDFETKGTMMFSMTTAPIDACEIKGRDGEWQRISIEAALGMDRFALMRCPSCHGRLSAHKLGTTGQRAHFEHWIMHPGCPLKAGTYCGTPSQHPEPLL
jgi:hypothetical protein